MAIRDALAGAGIDPERRAETLSFDEFAALSNAFGEVVGILEGSSEARGGHARPGGSASTEAGQD